MQSTLILDVECNSTTSVEQSLRKSPSFKEMDEKSRDDKLSSSLELHLGKERRNSISTLFSGRSRFSERQGSVPNVTVTQKSAIRPSSASLQSQSPKYISLKLYQYFLRGEQNTNNGTNTTDQTLTKLDETFEKIQHQLSEMSCESRVVQQRLSSLSQAITDLSEQISPIEKSVVKYQTMPKLHTQQRPQFNTLPRILPTEQDHCRPPLIVIGWDSKENSVSSESSDVTTPHTSQESDLDVLLEIENRDKYSMNCVSTAYDGVGSESEGSGEIEEEEDDNVFGITH